MAAKKRTKAKKKASATRGGKSQAKKKPVQRKGTGGVAARKPPKKKSSVKKASAKKKASTKQKVVTKKKASIKKKAPAKKKAPTKKKVVTQKKSPTKNSAPKNAAKKKSASAKKKHTTKKPVTSRPTPSFKAKTVPKNAAYSSSKKSEGEGHVAKSERQTKTRGRKNKHLSAKELRQFKQLLLNLRDSVVDEISFLAGDNLNSQQMERTGEEGTDNFNREFALKLVSSEQDIIYEIDEALRRIKAGTYGICEISGETIEKERLKVLPHARHSVKVQSDLEKGRARYRPFGPTISRS